jgi:hypothetical protein
MPPKSVKYTSTQARAHYAKSKAATQRTDAFKAKRLIVPGFTRLAGNYRRFGSNALGGAKESKFFDTAISISTGAGTITQLALIPQGDTESTRDGRLARIKSIQLRGVASLAPGAGPASNILSVYLILDTQANGAAAAASDVFVGGANPTTQMLNLNNAGRFRILKRWTIPLQPMANQSATVPNNVDAHVDYFKKVNITMDWSSTTGAITEIKSNNVFLLTDGYYASADTATSFNGNCRLRFDG